MKTLLAFIVLALGITLTSSAQCGTTPVRSGCVGECGNTYTTSYTVKISDIPAGQNSAEFCLAATTNSLCPNRNAFATMLLASSNCSITGNLNQGDIISLTAEAGDVIYITVQNVSANNSFICKQVGLTHFSLTK